MNGFVEIADCKLVNREKVKSIRVVRQVPKWDLLVEFDRGFMIAGSYDSAEGAGLAYEQAKHALCGSMQGMSL